MNLLQIKTNLRVGAVGKGHFDSHSELGATGHGHQPSVAQGSPPEHLFEIYVTLRFPQNLPGMATGLKPQMSVTQSNFSTPSDAPSPQEGKR